MKTYPTLKSAIRACLSGEQISTYRLPTAFNGNVTDRVVPGGLGRNETGGNSPWLSKSSITRLIKAPTQKWRMASNRLANGLIKS